MSPNTISIREWNPILMTRLVLIAGILGIAFQIFPDMEMMTFIVTLTGVGSLAASSQTFDERETQLLRKSYGQAFQWLITVLFFSYTLVVLLKWFAIAEGFLTFFGNHSLGITISIMCILLGVAGVRTFRMEN